VVERVLRNQQDSPSGSGPKKLLSVEASLMTPVQPMLVSMKQRLLYNQRSRPLVVRREKAA